MPLGGFALGHLPLKGKAWPGSIPARTRSPAGPGRVSYRARVSSSGTISQPARQQLSGQAPSAQAKARKQVGAKCFTALRCA